MIDVNRADATTGIPKHSQVCHSCPLQPGTSCFLRFACLILLRVFVLIKHYNQKERGEERAYVSLQLSITVHH